MNADTITSTGVLLAQAADLAFGAYRKTVAALVLVEEAEARSASLLFLAEAQNSPVNVPLLIEDLGIFAENLLHITDAFGHSEVRRRKNGRA